MANRGALRGSGRGRIVDAAGERHITAFIGDIYLRDHFTAPNGTLVSAHTPNESSGPGGPWIVETSPDTTTLHIQGNSVIPNEFTPVNFTDARRNLGITDGCFSWRWKNTATPSTQLGMHFRARHINNPSGSPEAIDVEIRFEETRIDEPDLMVFVRQGGQFDELQVLSLGTANGHCAVEIITIGARYQVWVNGMMVCDRPYIGTPGTWTSFGWDNLFTAAGAASLIEAFVTEFPSCPGAWPNATPNAMLPLNKYNPGATITMRMRWGKIGAPTTGMDNRSEQVQLRNKLGSLIRSVVPTVHNNEDEGGYGSASFRLDGDGNPSTATDNRAGIYQISANQIANTGGVNGWSIDTDNDAAAQPAGVTDDYGRGYNVAPTTLSYTLSNFSLGGAKTEPADTEDAGIFLRTIMGHDAWANSQLNTQLSHGVTTVITTNNTTSATRDVSHPNIIDERFPAAATVVSVAVTALPNAEFNNDPEFLFSSVISDTILVDARITALAHLQIDDDVFALSKNVISKRWRTDQSAFLWTRYVTSRARAVTKAGASSLITLDPEKPGTTITKVSLLGVLDGQGGWTLSPLENTASKPSGFWDKFNDLTAPSTIDSDPHLVGSSDPDYAMVAENSALQPLALAGDFATPADHWFPGKTLTAGGSLVDTVERKLIFPNGPKTAMFLRPTLAGPQYMDPNFDWLAAVTAGTAQVVASFNLVEFPPSSGQYVVSVPANESSLATWGTNDLICIVILEHDGFPYTTRAPVIVTGEYNRHGVSDVVDLTHSLDDHEDVVIVGPQNRDLLFYDSPTETWKNQVGGPQTLVAEPLDAVIEQELVEGQLEEYELLSAELEEDLVAEVEDVQLQGEVDELEGEVEEG